MNYLGYVPQDDCIFLSSRERKAVVDRFPSASSAIAFNQISHGLLHWQNEKAVTGGMQFFLEKMIAENPSNEGALCKA
jgi:nitrogenase subunit NifH